MRSLFLVAMTFLLVLNRFYFIHRFHCFILTPWLSTQFGLLIFNKLKTLQTNLQKNPFEIWRRFSYSFFFIIFPECEFSCRSRKRKVSGGHARSNQNSLRSFSEALNIYFTPQIIAYQKVLREAKRLLLRASAKL